MNLSFVLPCYNMEKYLARCLDSLLAQDYDPAQYEILVVNDGSRDNSLKIARDYESRYPNIQVIDKPNGGVGSARNTGLKASLGKYLYFFDPDDYMAQNVLGTLMSFAEKYNPEILAFEHTALDQNDALKLNWNKIAPNHDFKLQTGIEFIGSQNYTGEAWWYIVKKSFLEAHQTTFMEDRLMEDVIFTFENLLLVKKMLFVPLDVYRYIKVPNSIRTSKEPKHFRKFVLDCEKAVYTEGKLIGEHVDPEIHTEAYKRLKSKQQAIVLFLLLRLVRSDIAFSYVKPMLDGFRKIEAYPLNYLLGKDFNGPIYKLLTFVVNTRALLYPFMYGLRFFYRLADKLK